MVLDPSQTGQIFTFTLRLSLIKWPKARFILCHLYQFGASPFRKVWTSVCSRWSGQVVPPHLTSWPLYSALPAPPTFSRARVYSSVQAPQSGLYRISWGFRTAPTLHPGSSLIISIGYFLSTRPTHGKPAPVWRERLCNLLRVGIACPDSVRVTPTLNGYRLRAA